MIEHVAPILSLPAATIVPSVTTVSTFTIAVRLTLGKAPGSQYLPATHLFVSAPRVAEILNELRESPLPLIESLQYIALGPPITGALLLRTQGRVKGGELPHFGAGCQRLTPLPHLPWLLVPEGTTLRPTLRKSAVEDRFKTQAGVDDIGNTLHWIDAEFGELRVQMVRAPEFQPLYPLFESQVALECGAICLKPVRHTNIFRFEPFVDELEVPPTTLRYSPGISVERTGSKPYLAIVEQPLPQDGTPVPPITRDSINKLPKDRLHSLKRLHDRCEALHALRDNMGNPIQLLVDAAAASARLGLVMDAHLFLVRAAQRSQDRTPKLLSFWARVLSGKEYTLTTLLADPRLVRAGAASTTRQLALVALLWARRDNCLNASDAHRLHSIFRSSLSSPSVREELLLAEALGGNHDKLPIARLAGEMIATHWSGTSTSHVPFPLLLADKGARDSVAKSYDRLRAGYAMLAGRASRPNLGGEYRAAFDILLTCYCLTANFSHDAYRTPPTPLPLFDELTKRLKVGQHPSLAQVSFTDVLLVVHPLMVARGAEERAGLGYAPMYQLRRRNAWLGPLTKDSVESACRRLFHASHHLNPHQEVAWHSFGDVSRSPILPVIEEAFNSTRLGDILKAVEAVSKVLSDTTINLFDRLQVAHAGLLSLRGMPEAHKHALLETIARHLESFALATISDSQLAQRVLAISEEFIAQVSSVRRPSDTLLATGLDAGLRLATATPSSSPLIAISKLLSAVQLKAGQLLEAKSLEQLDRFRRAVSNHRFQDRRNFPSAVSAMLQLSRLISGDSAPGSVSADTGADVAPLLAPWDIEIASTMTREAIEVWIAGPGSEGADCSPLLILCRSFIGYLESRKLDVMAHFDGRMLGPVLDRLVEECVRRADPIPFAAVALLDEILLADTRVTLARVISKSPWVGPEEEFAKQSILGALRMELSRTSGEERRGNR